MRTIRTSETYELKAYGFHCFCLYNRMTGEDDVYIGDDAFILEIELQTIEHTWPEFTQEQVLDKLWRNSYV
jgi:hypothetical protein